MRASKSAVVARLLGTVSKRAAISVILTLCGVVALWFGTNTIDPEHGPDDAGGQVFVGRGFEVEFWILSLALWAWGAIARCRARLLHRLPTAAGVLGEF